MTPRYRFGDWMCVCFHEGSIVEQENWGNAVSALACYYFAMDAPSFAEDELYDQAARIIVTSGKASISFLQRRLRIGFSRAARLVDMMEADGLVSPDGDSKKPREVLVKPDYFDEVDSQTR